MIGLKSKQSQHSNANLVTTLAVKATTVFTQIQDEAFSPNQHRGGGGSPVLDLSTNPDQEAAQLWLLPAPG